MTWSSNESDDSGKYRSRDRYRDDRDYKSSHSRKRTRYSDSADEPHSSKRPKPYDIEQIYQPQILSFKQFLATQDDGIDDAEAKQKYTQFKEIFQKKLISDFFENHKNEEWFRQKYHPLDSVASRKERKNMIEQRLKTFEWLYGNGWISGVTLEISGVSCIEKLMDAASILLEGGSHDDLAVLDLSTEKVESLLSLKIVSSISTSPKNADENGDVNGKEQSLSEHQLRPLHRKQSLFFRSITPDITKKEVEALGRQYEGFIRCALHDPSPNRKWLRRTWLTFQSHVNIKDTCWNVNQLRLKDCELSAVIDHNAYNDRIKAVTPNSCCNRVVRADILTCGRLIATLDQHWGLWTRDGDTQLCDLDMLFKSNNPFLSQIEQFVVDSGDFDMVERLGLKTSEFVRKRDVARVVDKSLLEILDKLILYLRLVYSIDYYTAMEYSYEDEMPCKCLILHVRPSDFTLSESSISGHVVEEWLADGKKRVDPLLKACTRLSDEESMELGLRNQESAVTKFLDDNTQELAVEKFLCPLSGKKFKGPEFVHKHIFNKYGDKIEECKQEVIYFNNYIRDPFRPSLAVHPSVVPYRSVKESVVEVSYKGGRHREEMPRRHHGSDPRTVVDYSGLAPNDLFEF